MKALLLCFVVDFSFYVLSLILASVFFVDTSFSVLTLMSASVPINVINEICKFVNLTQYPTCGGFDKFTQSQEETALRLSLYLFAGDFLNSYRALSTAKSYEKALFLISINILKIAPT